jgi:hypothetical protein
MKPDPDEENWNVVCIVFLVFIALVICLAVYDGWLR